MKIVGAGAAALGVVEGIAEATANVVKAVSCYWSDRVSRRKQPSRQADNQAFGLKQ